MQSIYYFLFWIGALSIHSCKNDDNIVIIYEAGDQEFGWAKGTKEGKFWESSGFWRYHQNDSTFWGIDFMTYSTYGALREVFSLNEIPFSTGTFSIKGQKSDLGDGFVGGSFGLLADDGDALIGFMQVNDEEDGFITISEIDTLSNTIQGVFEIYFISEDKSGKVEIMDGEFEVRLYK